MMSEKLKVLYVDDEEINLFLFSNHFKEKYEVYTATDGFLGLTVLEENTAIRVVISDFRMPKINGVEFIKKARERYPDKKYFILTGYETTDEIKAAVEDGIILEKFSKPMTYNRIERVIKEALEG